ncbi:putative reverse transcriptase domain-containing protein [Tanacetum coccineum]
MKSFFVWEEGKINSECYRGRHRQERDDVALGRICDAFFTHLIYIVRLIHSSNFEILTVLDIAYHAILTVLDIVYHAILTVEGAAVVIPMEVVKEVSSAFDNTLYGYFIGKRLAFLLVENYVKNTWAKFGLRHVMHKNGESLGEWSLIMPPRKAPRTRTTLATTTNTTSVTKAKLQVMIDQGVATALATRIANRSTNGEDSHNSGTGVRRTERVAQENPAAARNQRTLTCYECGNPGHYRSDCPELKNQNHRNQAEDTGARGLVHALGGGESDQDLNDMEDDISA